METTQTTEAKPNKEEEVILKPEQVSNDIKEVAAIVAEILAIRAAGVFPVPKRKKYFLSISSLFAPHK